MKYYDYYYLAKRNLLPGSESRGRIIGQIKKGSKIHVSAVCGKAMASIACMLKESGHIVTGSDTKFSPPMKGVLQKYGIKELKPSAKNLKGIDTLIIGNALSYNSLESIESRKRGIATISGAEAVAEIFKNKRALVVTGTHGKTTTSALLTSVFIEAKKDPAYMIGGVFQNSDNSYSLGRKNSKFAIYEGDEYNCAYFDQGPKFLRYNASSVILTSIEHDHVDLYPTFEDYKQAFQFLIENLPKDGFLVIHESTLKLLDISRCQAKVFIYGKSKSSDVYYTNKKTSSEHTTFEAISKFGKKKIQIPMFGEYNIENSLAVYILSILEGIPQETVIDALKSFPGTKERQELLGTNKGGSLVIRDYAHHPTAVSVTLDGIRDHYRNHRIVVVFEPRSNSSRKKVFENLYSKALEKADALVIINPEMKEGENLNQLIDTNKIKETLISKNKMAYNTKSSEEALKMLGKIAKSNDVVVFMSSGDMDGIPKIFLEK